MGIYTLGFKGYVQRDKSNMALSEEGNLSGSLAISWVGVLVAGVVSVGWKTAKR